jgi:hypothetical protein
MKYALVIFESDEQSQERTEAERDFDALARWWADLRVPYKIVASARLASTRPVTSVSWRDGHPIPTDGPYMEAKESVAGFLILEVDAYSDAMEIVASLPAKVGTRIEVRRVLER